MGKTLPPGTTLQVILADELRPGDIVVVNLKDRLESAEAMARVHETFIRVFGHSVKILINDDRGTIEIKRAPK